MPGSYDQAYSSKTCYATIFDENNYHDHQFNMMSMAWHKTVVTRVFGNRVIELLQSFA